MIRYFILNMKKFLVGVLIFGGFFVSNDFNIYAGFTESMNSIAGKANDFSQGVNQGLNNAANATNSENKSDSNKTGGSQQKATKVSQDDTLTLSEDSYDSILKHNKINDIVGSGKNQVESASAIRNLIYDKKTGKPSALIISVNKAIGTFTIIWLIILGIKFIFAQGAEEDMSKYKRQFGWIMLGLAVVSIAEFAAFQIFDPNEKLLDPENSSINNLEAKINQIKRFLQILAAGLALFSMIRSGYNLLTTPESGEDETITKEKEFIKAFLFAIIFIVLSETLVRFVFFEKDGTGMNAQVGIQEAAGFINFAVSFVGGAAVLMLILAALYYVTSFGDDDRTSRAKQIIISCIVAIIIITMAYTLIRFMIPDIFEPVPTL